MVVLNQALSITLIVIVSLMILAAIIWFSYSFVFSRNFYKKQLKELERRYTYFDALLIGQDSQYIHRLENISRTNLLYVEKYNEFSRRFKIIFDSDDKFALQMIKQLKTLIQNGQFKNIKTVISDTKKAIDIFEENVNALDRELYEIIKPEEESRNSILRLKENFRRVKQNFYSASNSLELVTSSFTTVFDKLDASFAKFETHLDGGEYEEANALIPVINNVILAIEKALEELPNLCILVSSIIPEKIRDLQNEYNNIERKGIPLFNLSYNQKISKWNTTLEKAKQCLIGLKISGVQEMLDGIQAEIANMHKLLSEEIEDKSDFDLRVDELYKSSIALEKRYVKLCSILKDVRSIFVINESKEKEIEILNESINRLGNTKRTLDNYIHSASKQPYSLLNNKLDELKKDYETAETQLTDFQNYLDSLKTSSEEAYTLVFVYYYRCKQIEATLREVAVMSFSNRYVDQINNCYNLLNDLDKMLKVKPINVDQINQLVEDLKNTANVFFDDVENRLREQQLAESAIVYGNRDRHHQKDAHNKYLSLEKVFFEGDFSKVYHEANDLYRRMHAEENPDATRR